jgi:hypothetical protein
MDSQEILMNVIASEQLKTEIDRRSFLKLSSASGLLTFANAGQTRAAETPYPGRPGYHLYQPTVETGIVYFSHPSQQPLLIYNHDADIVRFKDKYFATWNANTHSGENVPGQFNYLCVSEDFRRWSKPVRLFTGEAGSVNPIEDDNQWQPSFINYRDKRLFCAWCTFTGGRTFISHSDDGAHWTNIEVPTAPPALQGQVIGFPTTHGLLTKDGTMMFPCSLPYKGKFIVGTTKYAAILLSPDGGETWEWSDPIEAISWSEAGEDPRAFGGETIYLWEPSIFERPDGGVGALIRNSTAQDAQATRDEKSYRMILSAVSKDGKVWTKFRPIEVDSVCSRMFAGSGWRTPNDLQMVTNDWWVRIPKPMSFDRYFLSLFCAPESDPDLLLPGPVVQPEGGRAFYPNGFVEDGRLHLVYSYPGSICTSIVHPLPDYTRPFLLPRGSRGGFAVEGDEAVLRQRYSSLGLVLTHSLTEQQNLHLRFRLSVRQYNGQAFTVLTVGGKTRNGFKIQARYDEKRLTDVFEVITTEGNVEYAANFIMGKWVNFDVLISTESWQCSFDGRSGPRTLGRLLRKICFGGLYEAPEWPMGMLQASEIRLSLASIVIE